MDNLWTSEDLNVENFENVTGMYHGKMHLRADGFVRYTFCVGVSSYNKEVLFKFPRQIQMKNSYGIYATFNSLQVGYVSDTVVISSVSSQSIRFKDKGNSSSLIVINGSVEGELLLL